MIGFFPDMAPGVGEQAQRRYERNFRNTVYDMKVMLGKFQKRPSIVNSTLQAVIFQKDKSTNNSGLFP